LIDWCLTPTLAIFQLYRGALHYQYLIFITCTATENIAKLHQAMLFLVIFPIL